MKKMLFAALIALVLTVGIAGAGEKFMLRFGFETPRTDSQYIGAEEMARLVTEKSGGRLEIRLFPDSMLGSGPTMMSQMRGGTLDMYMGGSGFFANMAEELNILDIPFLFLSTAHADKVLEGELGRKMLDRLDSFDMKGLAFWENGFRCLTNARNPVTKADDVKGLKIRTLANPMHIEAWTLLGTNPVPMPLSELYTALETRTVEAQEHPLNVTFSAKLFEVQKYISVSNHAYSPLILAMNKKKFDSLPADLQQILIESAVESSRFQKKFIRENIDKMVTEMAAAGCEIVPAADMDMKSFVNVVGEKIRAMYLNDFGKDVGSDWLKEIDAAAD